MIPVGLMFCHVMSETRNDRFIEVIDFAIGLG